MVDIPLRVCIVTRMATSYLSLSEIAGSPLLSPGGRVNTDAATEIVAAARDADTAAREADTAAREAAQRVRHAARLYATIHAGPAKETAASVGMSPRAWADILGGSRDATRDQAERIISALTASPDGGEA